MTIALNQPVPELPTTDVERAQAYYRDALGCRVEWILPSKEMGAVSNGETAIFFRKRPDPFEPAICWIYVQEVDAIYQKMIESGADIVEPVADKPWGLRQFTIKDPDGNTFYLHS